MVIMFPHAQPCVFTIEDNSLSPDFIAGDEITIRQQQSYKPGDWVVTISSEGFCLSLYDSSLNNVTGKVISLVRYF